MNNPEKTKQETVNPAEAQSVFRKFQHTFSVTLLIRGFLLATNYLPVWVLRNVGRPFVVLFIVLNVGNYRAIIRNLRKIMPGRSWLSYSYKAYEVFRNYSYYLIDLFHLSHCAERLDSYKVQISGQENIVKALGSGKGVILLATHLGNWELGSLIMPLEDRKLHVVFSPDSSSLLEEQRNFLRVAEGIQEVPLSAGSFSSLRLLRVLQEGGIVALQGDRLTFDSGISMPFFGHDALFPKGPVKLALVSDSIVVPIFIPMTGYKSYAIIFEEPILMERSTGSSDDLKTNLRKIIKIAERYISAYPTQWFTFMPFWEED